MIARVALLTVAMALVVFVGIYGTAIAVQLSDGFRPGFCGSHCLAPGVEEDPAITLIGE